MVFRQLFLILVAASMTTTATFAMAGQPESSQAEKGASGLYISQAWIRAMPPGQSNTAAYFTLENMGREALEVVGASSTAVAKVEIHRSAMIDGMATMRPVAAVPLASQASVEFKPGGLHLMLLGLQQNLIPGESLELCLKLRAGETICTAAKIRKSAGQGGGHNHSHH
jgi:copper(I)-binding protein